MSVASTPRDWPCEASHASHQAGKAQGLRGTAWSYLSGRGPRVWILIGSLLVRHKLSSRVIFTHGGILAHFYC
jgi:hypothetical protein